MAETIKLPVIVLGRSLEGDNSDAENPRVTMELKAENGQIYEVTFSLDGIVSTAILALNWSPLRQALENLPPPQSGH
ncbi:MAG TPA: hypothetical protein VL492_03560 [Methylovirgula sp.]|nr:hypothetical protein [Methylovirgula sp.]